MKLSKKHRRRWFTIVNRLRKQLPAKYPVVIRTRPLSADHALLTLRDGVYRLTIDSQGDLNSRVDSLEHEYAHALDGWGEHEENEHRDSWGTHLARVRRVIHETIIEMGK